MITFYKDSEFDEWATNTKLVVRLKFREVTHKDFFMWLDKNRPRLKALGEKIHYDIGYSDKEISFTRHT